jgi:hypothetical protein
MPRHRRFTTRCEIPGCQSCRLEWTANWYKKIQLAVSLLERDYPKGEWGIVTLQFNPCRLSDLTIVTDDILYGVARMLGRDTAKTKVAYAMWNIIGYFKLFTVHKGEDGYGIPSATYIFLANPAFFDPQNYLSDDEWISTLNKYVKATSCVDIYQDKINKKNLSETVLRFSQPTIFKDREWIAEMDRNLRANIPITTSNSFHSYIIKHDGEEGPSSRPTKKVQVVTDEKLIECVNNGISDYRQIATLLDMSEKSIQAYLHRLANHGLIQKRLGKVGGGEINRFFPIDTSAIASE